MMRFVVRFSTLLVLLAMIIPQAAIAGRKADWQEAQDTNTIAGYTHFLAVYPNGRFSDSARLQLQQLRDESDRIQRIQEDAAAQLMFPDSYPALKEQLLQWESEAPDEVKAKIVELRSGYGLTMGKAAEELRSIDAPKKGAILALIEVLRHTGATLVRERGNGQTISGSQTTPAVIAAETLRLIGEPAIEPLIAVLKDTTIPNRMYVARAFGRLRDPRTFVALLDALAFPDVAVAGEAAEALWRFQDARAVEPLIHALNSREPTIARRAATTLGHLGDDRAVGPLGKMLSSQELNMTSTVAYALSALGDVRAVEPLIDALREGNDSARSAIERALNKLDANWRQNSKAVTLAADFIKELSSEDDRIQADALEALEIMKDPRSVIPVSAFLKHERWYVRLDAVYVLSEIGSPDTVEPLITVLRDSELMVREWAVRALGSIGDARAVEPLIAILQDEDRSLSTTAARALGSIGDARAIEPLILELSTREGESKKFRFYIEALEELTGKDFGWKPDGWLLWWSQQK